MEDKGEKRNMERKKYSKSSFVKIIVTQIKSIQ